MSIRKWFAAVLCVLLVSASLVSCSKDPLAPSGFITASGEAASFHFFVPEDWKVDLSTGAVSAYYSNTDPSSVSVMTWDLPNTDTTLDDWWDIHLQDVEMVFGEVELIHEADTTLDGVYAKTYIYKTRFGEYEYTIQHTAALKDYAVYLFTYTSLTDTFAAHEEEVAQMLSYFTFQ